MRSGELHGNFKKPCPKCDALRAENEKLKSESTNLREHIDEIKHLRAQLSEAQEIIEWVTRADGWSLGQGNAVMGKARGYLNKYIKQSD